MAILAVVASTVTAAGVKTGQSVVEATVHGYQRAFLTAAGLMAVALIIAVLVIRTPKRQATPQQH